MNDASACNDSTGPTTAQIQRKVNEKANDKPTDIKTHDVDSGKAPAPGGRKHRRHLIRQPWIRIPLKTVGWIIAVLLLIPVAVYIPPVQTMLKNVAASVVKKSTGMTVGIEKLRLKFPLDISLQGVTVIEASGDTMVSAREVVADVRLMPLLHSDIRLKTLKIVDGYYRMVSSDSSMVMKIRAGLLDVDAKSSANIKSSLIDLNDVMLRDGYVSLYMDVWKKKPTPNDSSSTPFVIKANHLKLENFRFAMSMLPTIDTLDFKARDMELRRALIDLRSNDVSVAYLSAADGAATYLTPTAEYIKSHPAPVDTVSTPGPPMTIRGDSVALDRFAALYGVKGAKPAPGFDPGFIKVSDVAIGLNGFYNRASEIRLPISRVMARERCGLAITGGRGTVTVDSIGLGIRDLDIRTAASKVFLDADIPFALMALNPSAKTSILADAQISPSDIACFMPSLNTYVKALPSMRPASLQLKADGSLAALKVASLKVNVPQVLDLAAKGDVRNPLDIKKMQGSIDFDALLSGPKTVDRLLGGTGYDIPRLSLKGWAEADRQTYSADFRLLSEAGDAVGNGRVSLTAESYEADIDIKGLRAGRFLPDMGIGSVTAHISADGAGFNPSRPGARTNANLEVASAEYKGHDYRGIGLHAELGDGEYKVNLSSPDPNLNLTLDAYGTVAPDDYTFDVRARINHADLQALGLSETLCSGNGNIYAKGSASPDRWLYDVDLNIDNLDWNLPEGYIHLPQGITAQLLATPASVNASVECQATNIEFSSASGLKHVVDCFTAVAPMVTKQIDSRHLEVEELQAALPEFRLDAHASGSGLIRQFLSASGMSVDTLYATISNDSLIHADLGLLSLNTGSIRLDTATLRLDQRGGLIDYRTHIGNAPGTLDEFARVNINGYLGGNRASVFLNQQNIQGETGYRLGLTAAVMDSLVSVHFSPLKATIAYLPWTLNADNHVEYTFANSRIDANLMAQSAESSIMLLTELREDGGEELHVNLKNIHIEDFLQMSVFAPPLKASVSADMRVGMRGKAIVGNGTLNVDDFTYDRTNVGDFELAVKAGMGAKGNSGGFAALKIDGKPALTFQGALMKDSVNGGLTPKGIKLKLTQFPLKVANPFLGADVARLYGALNGEMAMSGTFTEPLLKGAITCDSVSVFVPMIGSSLRFDDEPLTVADNVIEFNNFEIFAANKNPLAINGSVNARQFNDIRFDIGMAGKNVQLIGNDKRARSQIYGKLFMDLDASARGPMKHFDVNANLSILNSTDIYYQLQTDAQTLVEQQSKGEVVTFVQFSDTTQVQKADSVETQMAMRILASLNISPGTKATVLLSNKGTDRVELSPSGSLRYFQNFMGDMRLNGQLNIGEGFVRYSLPVMGEKKFTFVPTSHVLWNGDIMNPLLQIDAYDDVKVNVVQASGNTSLVDFKVGLAVTNTLSSPKVVFDLSSDDDITIQNELQSMSPDQRSQQAINILVTGQYSGQSAKSASNSAANIANSALYGFLTSQINSWAANNIRGVDLSFGVDQYDKSLNGENSTTTSYSYQVSKSLFNNKFKIVVGGNYSTDASADENFAQNLLSDISFEYMLKQTNTLSMYLKLFRHNGFESIVEGEITETGIGFVMRRRMSNLRQLFRIHRPKKKAATTETADSVNREPAKETDSIETAKHLTDAK